MNSAAQTHQPLVSVVIPCYNREGFVAEAIESVLKQTYQNFEMILVDDGSADRTEDVIQRYLTDPRVRYFKHDINRGIAAARNTGIKNSKGEYIAFLDSDDMWLPGKIEAQLEVFARDVKGEVGIVWSDAYFIDNFGNTRTCETPVPANLESFSGNALLRRIFMGNIVIAGTSMIRRVCFDKFGVLDERLRGGSDDFDLWLRLAPHFKFRYVPVPLAVVRLHDGNHTSVERQFRDNLLIIEKAIGRNPELAALKEIRLGVWHHLLGIYYIDQGNSPRAREYLKKALACKPFDYKSIMGLFLACCGPAGKAGLGLKRKIIDTIKHSRNRRVARDYARQSNLASS